MNLNNKQYDQDDPRKSGSSDATGSRIWVPIYHYVGGKIDYFLCWKTTWQFIVFTITNRSAYAVVS